MENRIEDIVGSVMKNPELLKKISATLKGNDGDIEKSLGDVVSMISEKDSYKPDEEAKDESDTDSREEAEKKSQEDESEKTTFNGYDKISELLSSFGKGDKGSGLLFDFMQALTKSAPLLIALKPFLSRSRCELIDTIIEISKLSSIVNLVR